MNYSELLQLAKGWGNFVSDRINIGRLLSFVPYSFLSSIKQLKRYHSILKELFMKSYYFKVFAFINFKRKATYVQMNTSCSTLVFIKDSTLFIIFFRFLSFTVLVLHPVLKHSILHFLTSYHSTDRTSPSFFETFLQ